jgi:uncharacterized RDD family membrane protein YckC
MDGNYGGFWIRFLALLVDSVICFTLIVLIGAGLAFTGAIGAALITPVAIFGPVVYYAVLQGSARQATFGKSLLGMKVSTTSGERMSMLRSFARELAKIISYIPLMLGFLLAAFTSRKQALHDMVASTVVTRESPGHVMVGLIVGLLGWVAPIGLVMAVGVGMFAGMMGGMMGDMKGGMAGGDEFEKAMKQAMQDAQKQQRQAAATPRPAAPGPAAKAASPAPAAPAGGDAEAALSTQLAGFDKPGTTRAGPAVLELSTTFNTSFWIKVYVPQSPDFTTDGAVSVTVTRVPDTTGGDLYDPKNSLETPFFQKVSLSPSTSPAPHLGGTRQVNLAAGAGTSTLSGAEGTVRFKLAAKPVTASFAAADAGKSKAANGLEVTLKSMKGNEAEIALGGDGSRIVGMLGYDAGGGRVRAGSTTTSNTQIKFKFDQPVARLDVVVAERFVERSFPFTLSKTSNAAPLAKAPAASVPSSPAKPEAAPTPPVAAAPAAEPKRVEVAAAAPPAAAKAAPAARAVPARAVEAGPAYSDEPSRPEPRYNDLMSAVLAGDTVAVEDLLSLGKWPDKPDSTGTTPLVAAVMRNDRKSAELLLKAGANPGRALSTPQARRDDGMKQLLERYRK